MLLVLSTTACTYLSQADSPLNEFNEQIKKLQKLIKPLTK